MHFINKRPLRQPQVEEAKPQPREYRKLVSGGLAGFSGVCVVQLIGSNQLDFALQVSLYAFAVAIPLLVKDLLDAQIEERHGIVVDLQSKITAISFGIFTSMIGISGIFWHFSKWIGIVFLASCFLSAISHNKYFDKLSELIKNTD